LLHTALGVIYSARSNLVEFEEAASWHGRGIERGRK